jgi:putative Holliday junction resolvase
MPRIAAIDYGRKRIGVALSDERKIIALPYKVVEGGLSALVALLLPLKLEKVLVGLPLLLSGKKGEMALEVEKFAQALGERLSVPIELIDERLSSRQVERELEALERKKRSAYLDTGAACLLLQTYLDTDPKQR